MTTVHTREFTIGEVSADTGVTIDSLRWFEREGLYPTIRRNSGGQRRYSSTDVERIKLVLRLRRTGMPVREIKRFVELLHGGEETHSERLELLLEQRVRILAERARLHEDLCVVDKKIAYYRGEIGIEVCRSIPLR